MRLLAVRDLGDMPAPVTVVGDVHLSETKSDVLERFLGFLDTLRERGSTLVLLGDLFDWWVGPEQAREPLAVEVLGALGAVAARGVRLAFLAGNRDFAFAGADGLPLEIWPDVVRAQWGARTVVLSHGDLLCTADHQYLRYRRAIRSRAADALRASLPQGVLHGIARRLRRVSTRTQATDPRTRLGIDYGLARHWLEAYDADALVLGHVHTGVHHRLEGPRPRDVYVLRDWDETANAVVFDGQRIALVQPDDPSVG